jgi:deleted-in-malignant-brain-tumors protein 1
MEWDDCLFAGATGYTSNSSSEAFLLNVQCTGMETRLGDCPSNQSSLCTGLRGGVRCSGTLCIQGAIRLQGGTSTDGRVEICNNNIWGTVCDDAWGISDVQVACGQLGLLGMGEW